jgi:hypothetical protein
VPHGAGQQTHLLIPFEPELIILRSASALTDDLDRSHSQLE